MKTSPKSNAVRKALPRVRFSFLAFFKFFARLFLKRRHGSNAVGRWSPSAEGGRQCLHP